MKVMNMNANNDILYEMVKNVQKYVTELINLNKNDMLKLDYSDWQYCLFDIESSLFEIEKFIKNGKDD